MHEVWFGVQSLKDAFLRLYLLSNEKQSRLSDLGWWEGELWKWKWSWIRPFFVWEEEVWRLFYEIMVDAFICKEKDDDRCGK